MDEQLDSDMAPVTITSHHLRRVRPHVFLNIMHGLQTFWLLTESDFWTFVIPNTAFGIFGALDNQ